MPAAVDWGEVMTACSSVSRSSTCACACVRLYRAQYPAVAVYLYIK